jgi:hypothetical protein
MADIKVWIEVPDFGALVNGWISAVDDAFNDAGEAVFGKDIEYNVVESKAATGSNLYTVNIKLESGDTQIVQIVFAGSAFHTFFQRNPSLDPRTAAFIAKFVTAMQSQWILDPEKVAVK